MTAPCMRTMASLTVNHRAVQIGLTVDGRDLGIGGAADTSLAECIKARLDLRR